MRVTMATSRQHPFGVTSLFLPVLAILLVSQLVLTATASENTTSSVVTHEAVDDTHGDNSSDEHEGGDAEPHRGHGGVHVASWNLKYVQLPLTVTFFALFVGVAKIGFHHADFLSAIFPESVLLIVLGVVFGGIAYATKQTGSFDSQTFFLYLLPPIILEAAYSLHDRTFADNLASILIYAVVGTLLNTFLIGLTLYGISLTGAYGNSFTVGLIECLIFSSLISAVDPVAVLAIFQEIHVNQVLYFLVFGESLLNDAVTVVLYNMMNSFLSLETIPASQIVLGFVSFFTVSLGGAVIGFLVGILTAFLTKYTKHVRVVEPLAILGMAYLSYLLAELFHFSGIISIICCGLAQAEYAFDNISRKSSTTVTYFTKMLSTTTESIIFLLLGQTLWAEKHQWNTGFVLCTLLFIFVYRVFGVVVITFVVNKFRIGKINKEEQFIMSYGGLRGAVAFSLVATLLPEDVPARNVFVTTTLVVILVTVFVQGTTIKPLVKLFRIKRSSKEEPTVALAIHQTVIDYVMAGIEEVIGHKGHNYVRMWIEKMNTNYIKKYLQRNPTSWEDEVMKTFEKVTNHDHHNHIFKLSRGEECRKNSETEMEKFKPMLTRECRYSAGDGGFKARAAAKSSRRNAGSPLMSLHTSAIVCYAKRLRRCAMTSGVILHSFRSFWSQHVPSATVSSAVSTLEDAKSKVADSERDSYFDSIRRRRTFKKTPGGEYMAISDKATPADVAGIMKKNPRNALHEKYDKNLLNDDCQDLPLLMRQRSTEHVLAQERITAMRAANKWRRAVRSSKSGGNVPATIAEESERTRDGEQGEEDIVFLEDEAKSKEPVVKIEPEIIGNDDADTKV